MDGFSFGGKTWPKGSTPAPQLVVPLAVLSLPTMRMDRVENDQAGLELKRLPERGAV
jgi:hypothetical protein